ncbi:hypothetical protein D6D19_09373 [Aureobasidium pullulans]|uniref:Uncharacterized protein n=1 Tax=Aureobasidium pullulans TaxID=5580 RepID=A0A4S8ZGR7_AURPU|nr:hypothetical protein D6D19_09373 [Aureobasidium pullulans]
MSSRLLLNGRRECVPRSAVPISPSEGERPSATPSDSGSNKNYKPPVRGFFSDDSKTHTSGSSSQVRRRYIGLPNEYARPAYSVGTDTGTDSSSQKGFNGTKTREAAWLTSQKLAIQNLGEHLKEATGYITALVKILDAVEDIRKGHKKEFEFPDDLSTFYKTCLPIREPFDHAGALAATLADKVLEYADGVSVALGAVQKLKYNGKARESSETIGRNAEECLISHLPSLLRAAEVLHGLYKIVERCKFEEDSEVPRFGTRDNVERLKRREQELLRLKNGMTGWVRELQNLDVDF